MRSYAWSNKQTNMQKAQEHTKMVEEKYSAAVADTKNLIYGPNHEWLNKITSNPEMEVQVINIDSVGALYKYHKGKTAVLNFASYRHPGGMFIEGSQAQEECLCHESILYNVLKREQDYYAWNGGHKTFEDFQALSEDSQRYIHQRLKALPNQMEYINQKGQRIILNHSGSIPEWYESHELLLVTRRGRHGALNPYTWDRHHYHCKWRGDDNTYIIHGHTPVPHIIMELDPCYKIWGEDVPNDEVLQYSDGHKFDLDIFSIGTGKAALFNLDTLEVERYFTTTEGILKND